jgi:hypothetical protein
MEKKKKINVNRLLTILTIFTTLSDFGLAWWGVVQKNAADKATNDYQLSVQVQNAYKDKNGVLVNQVETINLDKLNLKQSTDSVIKNLLVQIATHKGTIQNLQQLVASQNGQPQIVSMIKKDSITVPTKSENKVSQPDYGVSMSKSELDSMSKSEYGVSMSVKSQNKDSIKSKIKNETVIEKINIPEYHLYKNKNKNK